MDTPNTSAVFDPFKVLGIPPDAGEPEIRARYLELVKQFPPERDPDKFREIRTAFEAAQDPLNLAQRLLARPEDEAPEWSEVITEQKRIPPPLDPRLLLSLGNRDRPADAPDRTNKEAVE
ncbi:MAG: J domain-containing protein [Planctomycetota bacterium]